MKKKLAEDLGKNDSLFYKTCEITSGQKLNDMGSTRGSMELEPKATFPFE